MTVFSFSCRNNEENIVKDLLYVSDIHDHHPALFYYDSLLLAKKNQEALEGYRKLAGDKKNDDIDTRDYIFSKIMVLTNDSFEQDSIYKKLIASNHQNVFVSLELAKYSLDTRDSLFPIEELKEIQHAKYPPYYKGRACLLIAQYYDVMLPEFDSTWHYLQLADFYFSSTQIITRDYMDCIQLLSEHSTYRRKNLLAIRYANKGCDFEKYWPGADDTDKALAYANRAFMLFREDDFEGTMTDVEEGLKLIDAMQNPQIFQSLLKSKLVVYMLKGPDSLWQKTFRQIEENVEKTGIDFIDLNRWKGQYLFGQSKFKEAIPILTDVWKKQIRNGHTSTARYSTLCYLLSNCHLYTGDIDGALQFMYANQRRFDAYHIDSMLHVLSKESIYPFSPAVECANIYLTAYQNTKEPNHLKDAERFLFTIDQSLYSDMKVDDENALLQFYLESGKQYFDIGLHVYFYLYQMTGDESYFERFLEYSEKRKSSLLHRDILSVQKSGHLASAFSKKELSLRAAIKEEKRKGMKDNVRFNKYVDDYEALEKQYKSKKTPSKKHELLEGLEQTNVSLVEMTQSGATVCIIDETNEGWYYTLINDKTKEFFFMPYDTIWVDSLDKILTYFAQNQGLRKTQKKENFERMFLPMGQDFRMGQKLILIPDGIYHRLPVKDVLTNSNTVVDIVPSIRVWKALNEKNIHQQEGRVVAFAFSDEETIRDKKRTRLVELPGTFKEVSKLKQDFPNAELYTGKRATIEQFRKVYQDPDVTYIHLALHGKANSIEKDDVKLYFRTKDGGLDSLYGYELLRYRSSCRKVVLSACQSGLGKYIKGEGNYSLPRYFMLNGAYDIQSNLWDVVD